MTPSHNLPFTNSHLALIYHLSFIISVYSMPNAKSMVNGQFEMLNASRGGLKCL